MPISYLSRFSHTSFESVLSFESTLITEEIWQALPHDGEALMIARYPEYTESLAFPAEERDFEMDMNAIRAVRSRRAEMNVPPSRKAHLFITTDRQDAFRSGEIYYHEARLRRADHHQQRAAGRRREDGLCRHGRGQALHADGRAD